MTKIENEKTKENNNTTSDELIKLKKDLANDVTDKLVEKNSNFITSIKKWVIKNYLIDKKNPIDKFFDKYIIWGLWKIFWLLPPNIKKYREKIAEADTKNKLEELRKNIFDEIWWTEVASTTTQETLDKEPSESTATNEKTSKKENEEKVQEGFDKEKKTYTNPKSNLTYKCFDQVLDPAGKLKYPDGKTVGYRGCLLASGATITSALCPSVTLTDCFNNVRHRTADKAVEKMSDNKRKATALLKWENWNRTKAECKEAQKKIEENLQRWYPAIIGARHKGIDGINDSIESQHYRAIVDMRTNNGKNEFFVANTYKNSCWWRISEDKIFKNMIHASIFEPSES